MNVAHPSDEQLSAYLDGEADAPVATHVEDCAVCAAGLEQLRAVVSAVATPVAPPPPDVKERAIAFALTAGAEPADEHLAPVVPMTRRRPRVLSWLLPAAAAIVALLVAVPLISNWGGGGSGKKAASTASATTAADLRQDAQDQVSAEAATTTTTAGEFSSAGGAAAAPAAGFADGTSDLGPVNDVAQLRARVNGELSATESRSVGTTAKKSTATTASCQPRAAEAAGAGRVEAYHATLRWQGRPATVFAYRRGQEPVFLVVVADGSCAVLVTTNA